MKTILIVEDDQKIALALQVRLKANRYAVSVASDAIQGANLGRTVKPHLILLDISMPGGDGFQLAETFHKMPETKGTSIVFITASKSPQLLQKVTDLGAVGLFEKPFDTEKLLYSIERELNRLDSLAAGKSAASASSKQDQGPKQVLIIEDDQNLAMALGLRLKAAGYGTTTTYDALTGLNAAVSNPPALVLLDISMPAGNGFSVAEKIQTLIPTPTPIIFLTASKKSDFRERAKELGAVGYFEKPYEAEELFGAIREALA
ncbi:MAG TPA: response regulator [Chthoniobacterales bacterium]|jgi:DNA-binding response OmpR family regulator|nr:response regulator [Chthoniobacterales bacterium]